MLWIVSFNLCMGRAPHSLHACSCVLRGLFMCVMCSVMRVRFCCFAGGIFSFMAFGGGVCPPPAEGFVCKRGCCLCLVGLWLGSVICSCPKAGSGRNHSPEEAGTLPEGEWEKCARTDGLCVCWGARGLVGVIEHAPASFGEANLRCMTVRTTFLRNIAAHVMWLSPVSGGFL